MIEMGFYPSCSRYLGGSLGEARLRKAKAGTETTESEEGDHWVGSISPKGLQTLSRPWLLQHHTLGNCPDSRILFIEQPPLFLTGVVPAFHDFARLAPYRSQVTRGAVRARRNAPYAQSMTPFQSGVEI